MPYRIALFDLDHTLLDSDESERLAFAATLGNTQGSDPDSLLPTFIAINRALWRRVERGELTPDEVKVRRFAELVETVELDADPHELANRYAEGLGAHGELYPGAAELLDHAASVATLGLVTNGIGQVQRARIERLGLEQWFRAISISGELGVAKPNPAILDDTFRQIGLAVSETGRHAVMIGDNLNSDIAVGIAAEIDTIWFNPTGADHGSIEPTHQVASLSDIGPLLG